MTIKRILNFATIALFSISQNNFAMEKGSSELSCPKARDLKKEESDRSKKRLKIFQGQDTQDNKKFEFFGKLDPEIRCYILLRGLESIIHCNSIYSPLDGVKEYLNALSLTNNECKVIVSDFGWQNHLLGNNKEPLFKIIAVAWFVPESILGKNKAELNEELITCLSRNTIKKFFNKTESSDNRRQLSDEIFSRFAAMYLIAGASPNVMIDSVPLYLFVIRFSDGSLVPLILLKKVDIRYTDVFANTALMEAVPNPKILKMLLDYDHTMINFRNNTDFESALDRAAIAGEMESAKLLLEYGAHPDSALCFIMTRGFDDRISEDEEIKIKEQDIIDLKIAKLLVKFGAKIDDLPSNYFHPIINEGWLFAIKRIQDFKKSLI